VNLLALIQYQQHIRSIQGGNDPSNVKYFCRANDETLGLNSLEVFCNGIKSISLYIPLVLKYWRESSGKDSEFKEDCYPI